MNTKSMKFAPIIRVSTEKQETQGESLRTQKKQIIEYVERLNGTIPEDCWQYSGQEHATAEYERKRLNEMLADSAKGSFDAVIVCDASRWSRDNLKSKQGLEILRQNNIRFFVGVTDYDLHNPEQCFFLGMAAEIGEYQAKSQNQKSVQNRIERAKRGIPVVGKLPPGRTYDKKTGRWGIDEVYQKKIQRAAEMFLSGESLKQVALKLGLNRSGLRKNLVDRCGNTWPQTFKVPRFKINETIETKVPPLLPDDMIAAVRERLKLNKTIFHGQTKNKYLLGRMVLCGHCGRALFGLTSKGKQYYRHSEDAHCKYFTNAPGKPLEDAVMVNLFSILGNRSKMEEAIKRAVPDLNEIDNWCTRMGEIERELPKIDAKKEHVIDMIETASISPEDVKKRMSKYKQREASLKIELKRLKARLDNLPSGTALKRNTELLQSTMEAIYRNSTEFSKMSFDEKRKLAQFAFSGKDQDGKRSGVYVKKDNDGFSYTITGVLGHSNLTGFLPLEDWQARGLLGIEDDNYNPLGGVKQKVSGGCD